MSSPATAPDRRTSLWNAMLIADFNVCYWTLVSRRDTRYDLAVRGVLALSSSGVTAWTVWSHFPVILTAFSLASSIVAWLHTVVFTTERLRKVAGLVGSWKQIEIEYELLWQFDPDLCTPETWKRFEEATRLQGKIDESGLKENAKLKEQAWQQMLRRKGLLSDGTR